MKELATLDAIFRGIWPFRFAMLNVAIDRRVGALSNVPFRTRSSVGYIGSHWRQVALGLESGLQGRLDS